MLCNGLPLAIETAPVVCKGGICFRSGRINLELAFSLTIPAFLIGVTAAAGVHEIDRARSPSLGFVPTVFERIPSPRGRFGFLKEVIEIADGDAAKLDALRCSKLWI